MENNNSTNTTNPIKEVHFSFENCEGMSIPFDCFKEFTFEKSGQVSEFNSDYIILESLKCTIIDNHNIEYNNMGREHISPIKRLEQYNDITRICITYEDDSEENFTPNWFDVSKDNNELQSSELISYREIHITIKSELELLTEKYRQHQDKINSEKFEMNLVANKIQLLKESMA